MAFVDAVIQSLRKVLLGRRTHVSGQTIQALLASVVMISACCFVCLFSGCGINASNVGLIYNRAAQYETVDRELSHFSYGSSGVRGRVDKDPNNFRRSGYSAGLWKNPRMP